MGWVLLFPHGNSKNSAVLNNSVPPIPIPALVGQGQKQDTLIDMKTLKTILNELESKTPTKTDYLNLYKRIRYSIESALPPEKDALSRYKLLTKTAWIYRELVGKL